MFKAIYNVQEWKGKKTSFHKKYYVFDGLGNVYFETLHEARTHIRLKATKAENLYKYSKNLYCRFTEIYMEKLIDFRIKENIANEVKAILQNCLEAYQYMTKKIFGQYMLGKLKFIYMQFEQLSKLLKADLLTKRLRSEIDIFFSDDNYPSYMGEKSITTPKKEDVTPLSKPRKLRKAV